MDNEKKDHLLELVEKIRDTLNKFPNGIYNSKNYIKDNSEMTKYDKVHYILAQQKSALIDAFESVDKTEYKNSFKPQSIDGFKVVLRDLIVSRYRIYMSQSLHVANSNTPMGLSHISPNPDFIPFVGQAVIVKHDNIPQFGIIVRKLDSFHYIYATLFPSIDFFLTNLHELHLFPFVRYPSDGYFAPETNVYYMVLEKREDPPIIFTGTVESTPEQNLSGKYIITDPLHGSFTVDQKFIANTESPFGNLPNNNEDEQKYLDEFEQFLSKYRENLDFSKIDYFVERIVALPPMPLLKEVFVAQESESNTSIEQINQALSSDDPGKDEKHKLFIRLSQRNM